VPSFSNDEAMQQTPRDKRHTRNFEHYLGGGRFFGHEQEAASGGHHSFQGATILNYHANNQLGGEAPPIYQGKYFFSFILLCYF
jgi:hypothetical protein